MLLYLNNKPYNREQKYGLWEFLYSGILRLNPQKKNLIMSLRDFMLQENYFQVNLIVKRLKDFKGKDRTEEKILFEII